MESPSTTRASREGPIAEGYATRTGETLTTAFLPASDWASMKSDLRMSMRESQIALLMLSNHRETEVSAKLAISVHTVHSHVERLYRKLKVGNRSGLVVCLFEAYVRLHSGRPVERSSKSDSTSSRIAARGTTSRVHKTNRIPVRRLIRGKGRLI